MHKSLTLKALLVLVGLSTIVAPIPFAWAATGAVTILPLLRDGRPNDALTQETTDRLLRLGEDPKLARGSLSTAEQSCGTTSCLQLLAQRLSAARIVGGAVVSSGQRRYTTKLFLYDSNYGRIFSEERACEDCSERQLSTLVSSLAARLVEAGAASAALSAPPSRAPESRLGSAVDHRKNDPFEVAKAQTGVLTQVREAADSAARFGEANGKSLDSLRMAVERTRDATDKIRFAADKIRADVEHARNSSDKTKEIAERTREAVERTRTNFERAQEMAQGTQVAVERLRQSTEKTRESAESGRNVAEGARLQTEKLALVTNRAVVAAESARAESIQAREASTQASNVAGKTLLAIDHLNVLSTDLRSALTNVEPLRVAAEQTQQTAQVNNVKSAELLRLAESQRAAADDTLLRAERTLQVLKEQQARRGLSRRRKVAAGFLGGLTVLVVGASITLFALDGMLLQSCPYDSRTLATCALNLSPGYTSLGSTLSVLLGTTTVAVLAVPSSSGG